jgi:hypothetical protein
MAANLIFAHKETMTKLSTYLTVERLRSMNCRERWSNVSRQSQLYFSHLSKLNLARIFQEGNQEPLLDELRNQTGVRVRSKYRLTDLGERFVRAHVTALKAEHDEACSPHAHLPKPSTLITSSIASSHSLELR